MDEAIGWDVDHYHLVQLVDGYSTRELQRILHDAELEEHVAQYHEEPTLGTWQYLVTAYRKALLIRRQLDATRRTAIYLKRPHRKADIDFENIKSRIDIVEYIGRYIPLKKMGSAFHGVCIFHADKDPSLVVWPGIQAFRCFGCDAKGDIISFRRLLTERGIR